LRFDATKACSQIVASDKGSGFGILKQIERAISHTRVRMSRFVRRVIRKLYRSFKDRGALLTFGRSIAAPYLIFREYKRARNEFDWKFGVDTDGSINLNRLDIKSPNKAHGANYGATSPDVFWQAVASLEINYQDFVFVDLGSGKGRVVLLASELPFKEIIGIEFSPELNKIAQANVRRYKSKSQRCKEIRLVCTDFLDFPIPETPVFFFLYFPCKGPVMKSLVQKIKASVLNNPRQIYIIYVNPQLGSLIESADFVTAISKTDDFALYSNSSV
jgi:hypothetical protein